MLSENAKLVFNFMKAHDGEDYTAADISAATELNPRTVNGILTASFQRHRDADKNIVPLIVRVPGEIEDPATGLHKAVKFIQLTEDGRLFNPDAE
jgi:hypothetical protein